MSQKPEPIILGTVKDERSRVYDVVIRFDGEQPTIQFKSGLSPTYSYFLTTLLQRYIEPAEHRSRVGLWLDHGQGVRIAPQEFDRVLKDVIKVFEAPPRPYGVFEVTWLPRDPECPF